ncbi:MAG: SMP-30/gluconolactonase/LRE family protein, partial [Planctomycetota bacterium]
TIGVFLNPGQDPTKPTRPRKFNNRSLEYDSLGDRYTRFLLEEVLPIVESKYNLSKDPKQRAIGGSSSGAICAFTVAWNRPDQFGRVYSNVVSFTNLRGGNVYPAWIRKTEPKPIRVYMSDTSGDIDNPFGSWPWANQRVASALRYMGYDLRFDWAEGYAHNADFGSMQFPEAMKWLWRDEVHVSNVDTSDDLRSDFTLLDLLVKGEQWEVVADGLGFADATCTDGRGTFFFCDMRAPAVYRIDPTDLKRTLIAKEAVSGLMLGPDGRLYGCQGKASRVIAIDIETGEVTVVATDVKPNDLAVGSDGTIYITETRAQPITRLDPDSGKKTVVDRGLVRPNGIAFSRDGGTLAVSDSGSKNAWTFRVDPGGRLDAKMPTMTLRLPIDPKGEFAFHEPPPYKPASRGDGMAVDRSGRYYITSELGIQIFDPTERFCGLLPKPDPSQPLTSCVLGDVSAAEPDYQYLYVTNGNQVLRRKLKVLRD